MKDSLGDTLPTAIHPLMFIPNVEALCTEEQKAYWLPRCHSMEVTIMLRSPIAFASCIARSPSPSKSVRYTMEFRRWSTTMRRSHAWHRQAATAVDCRIFAQNCVPTSGLFLSSLNFSHCPAEL